MFFFFFLLKRDSPQSYGGGSVLCPAGLSSGVKKYINGKKCASPVIIYLCQHLDQLDTLIVFLFKLEDGRDSLCWIPE